MKLFHAFPRPPHRKDAAGMVIRYPPSEADRWKALEILRLILTHGLLCTPEKLKLYPNYNTENKEKQECLHAKKHHDEIVQSRACFTLVDTLELSKEYQLSEGRSASHGAHVDLFGEFAIGLDPVEARALGVMPTVYYYRHDMSDPTFPSAFTKTAGLGAQIVERLDEIRSLFSVLSYIEAKATAGTINDVVFPGPEVLKSMGIQVRYESKIAAELAKINGEDASLVFRLFNTDRVPAWNLVDFVEIMLSLYQTTDSTIEDAPLAFFQQREWRLVHHMMAGLRWFGLGNHPAYRNPLAGEFANAILDIKDFLCRDFHHKGGGSMTWFLNHCWVLVGTAQLRFRDFVREIVVPEAFCKHAKAILDSLTFASASPVITPLPPRWKITTERGIPRIVQSLDS
jgi:hypothetical protein